METHGTGRISDDMDGRASASMGGDPAGETPEDVAILYSWANLQGAKYRDFSASRREYRAQMRRRAAELLREQELKAAAEAEAAAAEAEAAAKAKAAEAERARRPFNGTSHADPVEAEQERLVSLQEAERSVRKAAAERLEAARRAEAAALAESIAQREEREIAEAQASGIRQAARYAGSELRLRQQGYAAASHLPGRITDPYSPAELPEGEFFERPGTSPQDLNVGRLRQQREYIERATGHELAPFRMPGANGSARAAGEQPARPRGGYRPDESSGMRPVARPLPSPSLYHPEAQPSPFRSADFHTTQGRTDEPQSLRKSETQFGTQSSGSVPSTPYEEYRRVESHRDDARQEESGSTAGAGVVARPRAELPASPGLAATWPETVRNSPAMPPAVRSSGDSGGRAREGAADQVRGATGQAPQVTTWQAPIPSPWQPASVAPPAVPPPPSPAYSQAQQPASQPATVTFQTRVAGAAAQGFGSTGSSFLSAPSLAAPPSPLRAEVSPILHPPTPAPVPFMPFDGSSAGRQSATPASQAGPAWLYPAQDQSRVQPLLPALYQSQGNSSAASASQPAADTLQDSRERVAARWFALKGVFQRGGREALQEAPPERQKENQTPMLAVFSLAGGVGKTSLVATLGRALSSMGEKVLLADTTSHGLLPFYFGASELIPGIVRTFSPPSGSNDAPIHLLSLDVDRRGHDQSPDGGGREDRRSQDIDAQDKLAEQILQNSRGTNRALLDLSANSAWVFHRVARMNPTILVPLAADMNSVISLESVKRFFHGMQDSDGRPLEPYFVLNQFDPSLPLHLDVREVLRQQLGDRLLPFVIHRAPAVSEALAEGMTVIDYAGDSVVVEDFMNLATWIRGISAPGNSGFRSIRWSER
jgi:cellulose synthase operon protein YhjQ